MIFLFCLLCSMLSSLVWLSLFLVVVDFVFVVVIVNDVVVVDVVVIA